MSHFSAAEIAYLQSQRLCRIATVGPDGHPHVVPVAFRYNPDTDTIDIGGHGFATRKKYRDVQANPWVAVVVDDVASVNPWRVRGIEIRGRAAVLPTGGQTVQAGFDPDMFRITPRRIVAWGIEGDAFGPKSRTVG